MPKAGSASLVNAEDLVSVGDGEMNREIQKSLTTAKKADIKLRKLQEEKAKRAAQWEAYAKSIKQKFIVQRKNFEKDLARIQDEITATLEAGQQASANLRRVVDQGVPTRMETSEEDEAHWTGLMAPAPEEPPSAFFRRPCG